MVAPYKPKLISPIRGQGVEATTIGFEFIYQAPDATTSGDFYFIRKRLTPTVQPTEYWTDANTWTTTPTYRTTALGLVDGDRYVFNITSTWLDEVYQWSMLFKNSLGDVGEAATAELFQPRPLGVMTISVDDPALNSRPMLRWSITPQPEVKQSAFRLAVFTQAVADSPTFDITDPFWIEQAVWYMEEPYVSSTVFRHEVGEDLASAEDYRVFGLIEDQYGVSSGWQVGPDFSTNFSPPPMPTVEFDPYPELGVMDLLVSAAFNLVDPASSSFDDGVGNWIHSKNSSVAFSGGVLVVTGEGMSFDEMLALQGTFTNQIAAYSTFAVESATRVTETTRAEILYWPASGYAGLIPVVAGQQYSGVFSCRPISATMDARMNIRWYDVANALLSTSTATDTSCPIGVWTECPTGAVTAPVGAVKAALEIEAVCAVDQVYHVDNVAFARSDSVVWTPGGLSVDLRFIVQRRTGSQDWEYIWNATRTNPAVAQDSNLTVAVLRDRSFPAGRDDVEYRLLVSTEGTGEVISSEIAQVTAPLMESPGWWLRCYSGNVPDMRIRAMDFTRKSGVSNDVLYVQNRKYGIVRESGDASPHTVNVRAWLYDEADYQAAIDLLESREVLYIQRNIGDGFFIHVTDGISYTQKRARGSSSITPRHFHSVDFTAEIVETPVELQS